MNNKELIESLHILLDNHLDKDLSIWAEHDEFGVYYTTVSDLTEKQIKRLIELGWFVDSDGCENPVEETKENNYNTACYKCDTCKGKGFQHYC